MLYALFEYLDNLFVFPGDGLYQYITFRAGLAFITSILIVIFIGKKIIKLLIKKQLGEIVRDLGLEGQKQKEGVPTMGGIIIIISILVPVLLFCNLTNIYIQLLILTLLTLGFIGGLDDYLKKKHRNKDGLSGWYKILGQVALSFVVGFTLYHHPDVGYKTKTQSLILLVKTNFYPLNRKIKAIYISKKNDFAINDFAKRKRNKIVIDRTKL